MKIEKRDLPPLSTLRGFEAAARHVSFKDASDELRLTQGAISRQIKTLEGYLGFPLFARGTRKVVLTHAGEQLFLVVRDALDAIEQTTSHLRSNPSQKTLVISVLPTLASTWVMPRLHSFIEAHSDIEVRIVASIEQVDFQKDNIDVAIRVGRLPGVRYGREQPRIDLRMVDRWDGVVVDELFPDILVPVLSEQLAKEREIVRPTDLLEFPLIHTSTRRFAWPDWLRAHGITNTSKRQKKYEFSHFFMSLDAALRGQGVAIVPRIVASLYRGRDQLIFPLPAKIPSAGAYYVLTREPSLQKPEVSQLHNWVVDEASRLRHLS